MDQRLPAWHDRITLIEQIPALERRQSGGTWTDCEVFEALVLSVLTNSVDWSKVQRIRHELKDCFCAFDPKVYVKLQHSDVEERLAWLRQRGAAAQYQRRGLRRLVKAAEQLLAEKGGGTIDSYVVAFYGRSDQQPIKLATLLGAGTTPPKLPGLGLPLASEFLKNLGYDVAKPDRHICRACGAFGWVEFRSWSDRSGRKAPYPSEKEMIATMRSLEDLARSIGKPTIYVDNALWPLCAASGLRFSNDQLSRLAALPKGEIAPDEQQPSTADGSHIAPEREDRFAWGPGDVQPVSSEAFEAALDQMYGKGNRPGVNGFMG